MSELIHIFQRFELPYLVKVARMHTSLPWHATRSVDQLVQHLDNNAHELVLQAIRKTLEEPNAQIFDKPSLNTPNILQTKKANDTTANNKRRPLKREEYIPTEYLTLPSEEDIRRMLQDFYDATRGEHLKMIVCAVCGRERDQRLHHTRTVEVHNIPNPHRLVPRMWIKQQLVESTRLRSGDRILLERKGLLETNGSVEAVICKECWAGLEKDYAKAEENELPVKHSLANDLWVGPVVDVLESLTLPEQLLIAQLYPRAFVYKLYPKRHSGDPSTLQRGIKGTVSTYKADVEGAISMIKGDLMPRPPAVLAELVSVTFVSKGQLKKKWFKGLFTVRRSKVHSALIWLKANNPHYKNVSISEETLSTLPEDDVPDEIMATMRHTTNEDVLLQETSDPYTDGPNVMDVESDFEDDKVENGGVYR